MALPALVNGVLSMGGHASTEAEVEALFVSGAPSQPAHRELVWTAYKLWARQAAHHFGHGEVWLAGTFVTHRHTDPHLRVVMFPATPSMVDTAKRRGDVGLSLLTLEDLFFMSPAPGGSLEAMRPVGAIMDAYIGAPAHMDAWDSMWLVIGDTKTANQSDAGYVSLRV